MRRDPPRAARHPLPALTLASLLLLGWSGPASAQLDNTRWLPAGGYFADPGGTLEPRFSLALIRSDILKRPGGPAGRSNLGLVGGQELQAIGSVGGSLHLWRPEVWPGGGLVVGLQGGVVGRFLMSGSANALMGSDWLLALPVEVGWDRLSGRVRVYHRSAHLGDEIIEATGATRYDYTFEAMDALAAYQLDRARIYGGGTWVIRSQLEHPGFLPPEFSDNGGLRIGGDGSWLPWASGSAGLKAGIDLQWADRSGWRRQLAGSLGFEARRDHRALSVGLVLFDGPSPVGQFFLNDEHFWGLEVRVVL